MIYPDRDKYDIEYTHAMVDFILKMLCRDRTKRLGSVNDYRDILAHPWFKTLDLKQLEEQKLKPPFKPENGRKFFNIDPDLKETVLP